jgi:hypothetical protein
MPGFPSGKFIQPSPFPLAVSYIMSKGFARQRAEPDLKENREHLEGTFYVPSIEAGNTPRFFRDSRNALRFSLKPVHNQTPLPIPINAHCRWARRQSKPKKKEVTHMMKTPTNKTIERRRPP